MATILKTKTLTKPTAGFFGWWVVAAAFITSGLTVGVPYYNIPFFYDYFQRAYGWSRAEITLGFPLAALLTIWLGPLLIHRFSPRKLIIAGSALTAISFAGFARMGRPCGCITRCGWFSPPDTCSPGRFRTSSSFPIGSGETAGRRWPSCMSATA